MPFSDNSGLRFFTFSFLVVLISAVFCSSIIAQSTPFPCASDECGDLQVNYATSGNQVAFCEGTNIILENNSDPNLSLYIVDWGDGTVDSNAQVADTFSHAYSFTDDEACDSPQIFSIEFGAKLDCADGESCLSGVIDIVIRPAPRANIGAPFEACVGELINFTNLSCNGHTYIWDFGNGEFALDENPEFIYDEPGFYVVSLLVSGDPDDNCGMAMDQAIQIIEILPQPEASFEIIGDIDSDNIECQNAILTFATNFDPATVYTWSITPDNDDGNSWCYVDSSMNANSDTIAVEFKELGAFTVTLLSSNFCGLSTQSTEITIENCNINSLTACPNEPVLLSASLQADTFAYLWSTGDTTNQISTFDSGSFFVDVTSPDTAFVDSFLVERTPELNATLTLPEDQCIYEDQVFIEAFFQANDSLSSLILNYQFGGTGQVVDTFTAVPPGIPFTSVSSVFQEGIFTARVEALDQFGCTFEYLDTSLVNNGPYLVFPTDTIHCVGEQFPLFTGGINFDGGDYFVNDDVAINPDAPTEVISFSAGEETFIFTGQNQNGCPLMDSTVRRIIAPPVVTYTPDTVCENELATATVVLTPINLFPPLSVDVNINGTINSFPNHDPMLIIDLPVNTSAGPGQYPVSITAANGEGCVREILDTILIKPLPIVAITIDGPAEVCTNEPVTFSLQSNAPVNNILVDGETIPLGTATSYTTDFSQPGTYTISYQGDLTNCLSTEQVVLTVRPRPDIFLSEIDSVCLGDPVPIRLNSPDNNLVGNVLTAAGQTLDDIALNATTDLDVTTIGDYTASIIVENAFGCTSSDSQDFSVIDLPVLGITVMDECFGEEVTVILNSQNTGPNDDFQLLIDGASTSVEDTLLINNLIAGTYGIDYSVLTENGCAGMTTTDFEVFALPIPQIDPISTDFCVDDPVVNLTANPPGGTFSGTGVSAADQTFTPPSTPQTNISIRYSFTDANGCTGQDEFVLDNIFPLPQLDISGLADSYCEGDPVDTIFGNFTGGFFSGPNVDPIGTVNGLDAAVFSPVAIGIVPISYEYTDGNGCFNQITREGTLNPLPVINLPADTFVPSGGSIELGVEDVPGTQYQWAGGEMTPVITVTEPGIYILTVTNISTTCTISDTVFVQIGVSTTDIETGVSFGAYPNPVRGDKLFLTNEVASILATRPEAQISLFSADGRRVLQRSIAELRTLATSLVIDLPDQLPSGTYVLRIGDQLTIPIIKLP